ncbi:MAG TPA: hypothetical protein VJ828_01355 [Lacipirellulaceae bacterium]|nr:hypothetical protein [Lacipirellulaceae bacterium]
MSQSLNTAPAIGIAYSMWLRARWSALGIALYLSCLAIAAQLFPGIREPVLLAALLLTTAITHLLQVFTLGPADLGVRGSGYPRHMFVFPLARRSLVGWPMLAGAITHGMLWILVATLVFKPAGFATPVFWPAALFAAATVWVQAISWTPFATPYARVPALAISITPLFCLGLWAGLYLERSTVSFVVVAMSIAWGVLAYVVGVRGLARARRGDDGNLSIVVRAFYAVFATPIRLNRRRTRQPFRSPAAAQLWHEWRRNACFLPAMLGMIGIPMLALNCQTIFNDQSRQTLLFGSVSVSTPAMTLLLWVGITLMLSATIGGSMGKFDLWGKEIMPSFFAVRPITNAKLINLKLVAAAMSAIASAAILLLMFGIWAAVETSPLNPRESVVRAMMGELTWRNTALACTAVLALIVIIWRGIAIGMLPSLTGRKWINVVIGVLITGAMTLAVIAGSWIYRNPVTRSDYLTALPWLLGVLVGAKACTAAATARVLTKNRLMDSQALACLLASWAASVATILAEIWYFGPLSWPVAGGVILLVPFSRLAIAPAALHWNRHR